MAENLDPWFWNDFIRIGPFTGSPERNAAADKRYKELKDTAKSDRLPPRQQPRPEPRGLPLPNLIEVPGMLFREGLRAAGYEVPRDGMPAQAPAEKPAGIAALPRDNTIRDRAAANQIPPGNEAFQPPRAMQGLQDSAAAAMETAVNPPPAVPVEAGPTNPFAPYRELYEQLGIGPRPTGNPMQDKADEYAQREMKRTRLLAQLAFASGLTAAGGPGWDQIGKGFANAAGVYDQGHARYLKALQNSADRYAGQQEQAYQDRVREAGAIADLYTAGEKNKADAAKLAQAERENKRSILKDYFGVSIPDLSDFPSPEEMAARQKEVDRYRLSLEKAGVDDIVDFDVSD